MEKSKVWPAGYSGVSFLVPVRSARSWTRSVETCQCEAAAWLKAGLAGGVSKSVYDSVAAVKSGGPVPESMVRHRDEAR